MKKFTAFIASFLLLAACNGVSAPGGSSSSSVADEGLIVVDAPHSNELVTSPLTVTGKARGTWYFEASFPVRLFDASGNEIAIGVAQAQGDWMTEDYVPFSVSLSFTTTDRTGTLVLQKDNPSGMPENDASVTLPVRFTE